MTTKTNLITRSALTLACAVSLPSSGWAWGQQNDWNNNNNNNNWGNGTPTPTPSPAPTPPPADTSNPDNRYITVDLEVYPPNYSKRGFLATGCSLAALIHFDAKLSTFRGYYEGSTRNPLTTATPPTSQPVTDPVRLTQAPPPPTPTPAPAVGQDYYDDQGSARDYARRGNRRRHHRSH